MITKVLCLKCFLNYQLMKIIITEFLNIYLSYVINIEINMIHSFGMKLQLK